MGNAVYKQHRLKSEKAMDTLGPYSVWGLKTSKIVGAVNLVHPAGIVNCSEHAAEFLLFQRDGLPNVSCTIVLNEKVVTVIAHLDTICMCNITFNITSTCALVNTSSIVGVLYRKVVCKLDPTPIKENIYGATYIDLGWTPLKLTHFAICLAFQTYGTSDDDTAVCYPTTQWGPSSWTITPSDVQLKYEYKRTHFVLNNKQFLYPPGVSIKAGAWDVATASTLAPLATGIWKCTILALWPP
jgi:hypothetical protein